MTEEIHIDFNQLRDGAKKLVTGKDEITTKLQEMQTMINSLLETSFKAQKSSPKFRESYDQWTKGAKAAIEGLQEMSTFLTNAVKSFDDVDTQMSSGLK